MTRELTRTEHSSPRRWFDETPLATLREEMDNLMESFFSGRSLPVVSRELAPSVDVAETDEAVEITTDLPGFRPEDVHVEVGEGYVTISGEQSEETTERDPDKKYHRVERRQGRFSRSVWLPCAVNDEAVDAKLEHGILTLKLPKADDAKRRKISVKG